MQARRRAAVERIALGSVFRIDGKFRDLRRDWVKDAYISRPIRTGIALSGGGIRSATLSLGFVEALASRGRFYGFDLMSTVSGGGYCGTFIRSLYVNRGDSVVYDHTAFADATLSSFPDQQYFRSQKAAQAQSGTQAGPTPSAGSHPFLRQGGEIKNPLWWLRENGRYLAPAGMSDYGYALAYIVRNWVTLLTFVLGCLMVGFALLQLAIFVAVGSAKWAAPATTSEVHAWLRHARLESPLLPLGAAMLLLSIGIGAAYWLSLPLPFARPITADPPPGKGTVTAIITFFLTSLIALIGLEASWPFDVHANIPTKLWVAGLITVVSAALVSAAWTQFFVAKGSAVDFRREQTKLLNQFNIVMIVVCGAAAIDCLALRLRPPTDHSAGFGGIALSSVTLASVVSFLVAKLPAWLGSDGSKWRKLLTDHADQFALAAGLLILASIALIADLLVLKLFWHDAAWSGGDIDGWVFGLSIGAIAALVLLLGSSVNFANLLALTPLYGSRLTRAYLGGSNPKRLDITELESDVTKAVDGDDIGLKAYMQAIPPAPFHLINVTRNRTVGDRIRTPAIDVTADDPLVWESYSHPRGRLVSYESSLTLHDRHGDRMVFGPFGMRVGAEFFGWCELEDAPSLGLLCAISGAAVGSGMGRRTSLGTAMALTLANVRLGYWWLARPRRNRLDETQAPASTVAATAVQRPDLLSPEQAFEEPSGHAATTKKLVVRRPWLAGLTCLYRELLGTFSTTGYWSLSDGGHSENSGALSLLERGCNFIVVCDNAQDPTFSFGDLEIFIRTSRTDIGVEVTVVSDKEFPDDLAPVKECFFNGVSGDWRKRVKAQDDKAFALLLKANDIPARSNGHWTPGERRAWIVWIKPNRFADLPADIATYAEMQPDFPQQSTANQFFDEAQWESYRRLGFEMGRRLFKSRTTCGEFLPVIYPRTAATPTGTTPSAADQ